MINLNIRIAHECPISIFDMVEKYTDYSYALVHLFEENEEYWNKFVNAKANGREVLLDNSIFELGEAFDGEQYANWIVKLQPDWYIVPDVLDSSIGTVDSFNRFISTYSGLPGKRIAVAQGDNYNNLVECYLYLANHPSVDKIAISFDSSFLKEGTHHNIWRRMMINRRNMLHKMLVDGIINTNKPHHLLGCALPQEFKAYRDYKWIDTVDTSNPVVHGMLDIIYDEQEGLEIKESVKLFTLIEEDVIDKWQNIKYNIDRFRYYCRG